MILADGRVEDSEISVFHKVYKECTGEYVSDIYKEIEAVRADNKPANFYLKEMANSLNDEGKKAVIQAGMMIAAADGDIDPAEINMVRNFGKALEMKPAEVSALVDVYVR